MNEPIDYRIKVQLRPGEYLAWRELQRLVADLQDTAASCFDSVPYYQCLKGVRAEFRDKVIATAWSPEGEMAGFCSMVILPAPGLGQALHLGLTCVRPEHRRSALTHRLTSQALIHYLLRCSPLHRSWISNVACVLSSLGNVALHFDQVYPSPRGPGRPDRNHLRVANAIDLLHRDKIFIRPDAVFDRDRFVFRGSVKDTPFQKRADETAYFHRDPRINSFYRELIDFERGDEVVQVGRVSLLTLLRHLQRGRGPNRLTGDNLPLAVRTA